jgi:hypothetical protein
MDGFGWQAAQIDRRRETGAACSMFIFSNFEMETFTSDLQMICVVDTLRIKPGASPQQASTCRQR